ncbi:MAG: ATP-binding protein, partial [Halobaculum sp.]
MAGVSYVRGPAIYATYVVNALAAAGGSVLLFDTVVSYGPLYRGEAAAVGLSVLPPAVGVTLWTFGLPPSTINLMPVLALPHVFLDAYAFLGSDMFEFDPATRRASERAAVDDVPTPVVIVDRESRVVTVNTAAEETFETTRRDALGVPLAELCGTDLDPVRPPETLGLRVAGRRRTFGVTSSKLRDTTDRHVGHTVVFQDLTDERRRRQRLGVLNRVLRHNLRNDLSVVRLSAEQVAAVGGEETESLADTIREQTDGLLALGEKARAAADALDDDGEPREIGVETVVRDAVERAQDRAATPETAERVVDVTVPETLRLVVDPRPLGLLVSNLVENALEHGDGRVRVTAAADGDDVRVTVHDDGPGIPDHERTAVAGESETPLEHGSGLGLWLVRWSTDVLGGTLSVDTTDGTTVTVQVPGRAGQTEGENGEVEREAGETADE